MPEELFITKSLSSLAELDVICSEVFILSLYGPIKYLQKKEK